jgi:hypothetical protein
VTPSDYSWEREVGLQRKLGIENAKLLLECAEKEAANKGVKKSTSQI